MNSHRALRLLPALLATLLASACGPDLGAGPHRVTTDRVPDLSHVGSAIIGGTTDSADKSVVLVYNQSGFLCTGSVISKRVILTAAHCTVSNENCAQPNCSTLPPSGYFVIGGTDPFNNADWFFGSGAGSSGTVTGVKTGPLYNGTTLQQGDVGILTLSADAPVAVLDWQKTRDNTAYTNGKTFKAVGYGISNHPVSNPGADTSGIKRTVNLSIQASDSHAFQYGSATKNTCSGDSGGPALVGNKVIGTVSYGDQDCAQAGVDMRTDDNIAFIEPFVSAGGGGSKKHGCSVGMFDPSAVAGAPLAMLAIAVVAASRRRARR